MSARVSPFAMRWLQGRLEITGRWMVRVERPTLIDLSAGLIHFNRLCWLAAGVSRDKVPGGSELQAMVCLHNNTDEQGTPDPSPEHPGSL